MALLYRPSSWKNIGAAVTYVQVNGSIAAELVKVTVTLCIDLQVSIVATVTTSVAVADSVFLVVVTGNCIKVLPFLKGH